MSTPSLATVNAKSRQQALTEVINLMANLGYTPLGYVMDESDCSCCRSEYFYIAAKIGNEYKLFLYDGEIKHKKDCAESRICRCSCGQPFTWQKIIPEEVNYLEEHEGLYFINQFTPIGQPDEDWREDLVFFYNQEKENEEIRKYNDGYSPWEDTGKQNEYWLPYTTGF